jgi:hypothetical protein
MRHLITPAQGIGLLIEQSEFKEPLCLPGKDFG